MKIIVQNLATEYQDEGSGPVLLFLHGWKDTLHSFDTLTPLLSRTHRIIRLDLPGFGNTEITQQPWTLDNYIQFVVDFITKLNLNVDVLVGHSFGGRIAIKGLAEHTLQAKKCILIAAAGIAKKQTLRNSLLRLIAKLGKAIIAIPPLNIWQQPLRKKLYQSIGSDYFGAGSLKETFLHIVREDVTAQAQQLSLPTLMIWGTDDTQTPLSDGKRLSDMIRGSELHVLDHAGHFVHREKPQEVAQIIQKFL